jgi:hypothetical protein
MPSRFTRSGDSFTGAFIPFGISAKTAFTPPSFNSYPLAIQTLVSQRVARE